MNGTRGWQMSDTTKTTNWPAVGDEELLRECQTYLVRKHNYGPARKKSEREVLLGKLKERLGEWND
jgi:hypothetical protein